MGSTSQTLSTTDQAAVESLYHRLLDSWNRHNADDYGALFESDANVIGFDGSQMNSQAEITSTLKQIFADHVTSAYIGKVREVRLLSPETALLRAIVGMVPAGGKDLNPAVNAIQTLVAVKRDGQWRITLFQNTPAQFHGRPDLAEALTNELRDLL
ncbi:MAG TPA: SgcJ/EcaC family oxidoreductase [Phototrophicaceae bacterium]|nr:SgcJ/EcaC family oxidoreductase [Phototrophicaceae bacterium]